MISFNTFLQPILMQISGRNCQKRYDLFKKSYAEDCRIYTPENPVSKFYNVSSALDVFVSAHFVGWTVKMLITRDFKVTMFQSVFFEILEITFRHWLNNFWECWWDHIILDIIICNTGGILFG